MKKIYNWMGEEKNNIQNTYKCKIAFVLIALAAFPFLLNFLLQLKSFANVIGDEITWLSFWGTYIGSILTGFVVLATFITIRKNENINKAQWRISWLNNYRNIASDMVLALDSTLVGQIAQDVAFEHYDSAVEKGHAMERAVNRCSFMLSSILKEYDDVFDATKGTKYIDQVNGYVDPFLKCTGEIIQFAIICKFLKEKESLNKLQEGLMAIVSMIDEMKEAGYNQIVNALVDLKNGNNVNDTIHDAIVLMQRRSTGLDVQGLEKLLLQVGQEQVKNTYRHCAIS